MCLILKPPFALKCAENPIKCYKVMELVSSGTNNKYLRSYYQRENLYNFQTIYTANGNRAFYHLLKHISSCQTVTSGFFHSYKYKKDALKDFNKIAWNKPFCIVECCIPAKSFYFEGHYDSRLGFASREIIFTEIIITKCPNYVPIC